MLTRMLSHAKSLASDDRLNLPLDVGRVKQADDLADHQRFKLVFADRIAMLALARTRRRSRPIVLNVGSDRGSSTTHAVTGIATGDQTRKQIVAFSCSPLRSFAGVELLLDAIKRLLVDDRRMGVLNDDRFVATERPIADSVEPALRVRSVDHRADVDRVSQDDTNRLALPIDAASRLDASPVQIARDRSAIGIRVGVGVEHPFDGFEFLFGFGRCELGFPSFRLGKPSIPDHAMHFVSGLVEVDAIVSVGRPAFAIAVAGLLEHASHDVVRQADQELVFALLRDLVDHPAREIVPIDSALDNADQLNASTA